MKEQMEMFERVEGPFNDGGLLDEGGTVDPVSGNEVPPGSTQEEVRDDIPAKLSEGEFVFPADVVRYWGLDTLMKMRQEAKMGLRLMEEMGQMGNSDEATVPDDIPFDINDLDMEDDGMVEFNVGGLAGQQGVYYSPAAPQTTTGFNPYTPTPIAQAASSAYAPPQQQAVPTMQPQQAVPKAETFLKGPEQARLETIINPDTGEERQINFIPGVTQIPDGFILKSKYKPEDKVTTQSATTQSQRVDSTVGDGDDNDSGAMSKEQMERIQNRIDAAKELGYNKFANPLAEMVKALVPGSSLLGFGKDLEKGTITGTGYVADGEGGLFDPVTGEKANVGVIQGIVDSIRGTDRNQELGKGSQAKQAGLKSLYDRERDERIDTATEARKAAEERLAEARKESRAAEIREQARMRAEKAAEIAAEKERIAEVQRRAREQMQQQYGGDDDSYEGSAQQQADDYTASRVAEAVATGDYSRGFAKGGMAKQMEKSGLTPKK